MSITVLNPGGRDVSQRFDDYAGKIEDKGHPPINYHGYAACVKGCFESSTRKAIALGNPVLLLIRNRLKVVCKALQELKLANVKVAVLLKETGFQQIANQFQKPDKIRLLQQIIAIADGCLTPTEDLLPFYKGLSNEVDPTVVFIPTPYPIDDTRWDFSIPVSHRQGIFLGTREFKLGSRNHLHALVFLKHISDRTNEPVTIFNTDGRTGNGLIRSIGFQPNRLRIHQKSLPYVEYLKLMASHKIVFQLDHSFVPGQVAGDTLLCRTLCIGGNSSIEKIVFPDFANRNIDQEFIDFLIALIQSQELQSAHIENSQRKALQTVSFATVAPQINQFFKAL